MTNMQTHLSGSEKTSPDSSASNTPTHDSSEVKLSSKRDHPDDDDDVLDTDTPKNEKRAGRRKIKIEYIDDKSRRHITFSKRKHGIMKKVIPPSLLSSSCRIYL
jgi:MADS-box transcription factor